MIKIKLTERWGYYPKGSNVKVSDATAHIIISNGYGYQIEDNEEQMKEDAREKQRAIEAEEEE